MFLEKSYQESCCNMCLWHSVGLHVKMKFKMTLCVLKKFDARELCGLWEIVLVKSVIFVLFGF